MWGRSCREQSCIQILILAELLTEPPWNWASTQSHTTGRETVHTVLKSRADEVSMQGGHALYYSSPSLSKFESCSPRMFWLCGVHVCTVSPTQICARLRICPLRRQLYFCKSGREVFLNLSRKFVVVVVCCCWFALFCLIVCLFVCFISWILAANFVTENNNNGMWRQSPKYALLQLKISGVKIPNLLFYSWKYLWHQSPKFTLLLLRISVASKSQIYFFAAESICDDKVPNLLFFCSWKYLCCQSLK